MKKKEPNKTCPWSSCCPQIVKCAGYFMKAYAGVGICLGIFLLVGLQIEQQYRSYRYMKKCLSHLNNKDIKLTEEQRNFACGNIYRESPALFEYYQGNVLKFMPKDSFK
jgi:hypothetical protein